MTISERVKNINPYQTLSIATQSLKMKREGKKVISFAAGEPDFATPVNIREEAILTLCNSRDEELLPVPCWVSYTEQIKFAQAVPILIPTYQEEAFQLSAAQVEEKITPKTKLLILNSPP